MKITCVIIQKDEKGNRLKHTMTFVRNKHEKVIKYEDNIFMGWVGFDGLGRILLSLLAQECAGELNYQRRRTVSYYQQHVQ